MYVKNIDTIRGPDSRYGELTCGKNRVTWTDEGKALRLSVSRQNMLQIFFSVYILRCASPRNHLLK